MKVDLLQEKMREKELLEAQLANLETEIETIEEETETRKVLVEKIPNGFSLGFKDDSDERLVVHLTEEEAKDMIREVLAHVEDFTFVLSPLAGELNNVLKDFEDVFKGSSLFSRLKP